MFREAVKCVSYLNKLEKSHNKAKSVTHQEKQYRSNFWPFAKNATNGTLNSKTAGATFTKEDADLYYPSKYSHQTNLDLTQLSWFPNLPVLDDSPFNMSVVKLRDI